ncbi:MAG: phosphoglycerate dehydrogenase [Pirellulales bacterium]
MPKVLVTPHPLNQTPGRYSEILQSAGFEIVYPPPGQSLADNTKMLVVGGFDAILASVEPLTRDVLATSKLRAVARMGVGFDSIDIPAATQLGVAVTITPGTLEESVAEHAIALMLGVYRDLVRRDRHVRAGTWVRKAWPRLSGKTLGLVGLGRIGKAVVRRAQGLGMTVVAHDPYPDAAFAETNGVRLLALDELLRTADVVSLHLPTTPETVDLINARTLALMKRDAVLINTARGAMVDEAALVAALQSGHLLGAGLDVFKEEPLPTNSPLLDLDNVLLCEHMGGLDEQSQEAMANLAAQCLADLYEGRWPERCVVNRELGAQWRW